MQYRYYRRSAFSQQNRVCGLHYFTFCRLAALVSSPPGSKIIFSPTIVLFRVPRATEILPTGSFPVQRLFGFFTAKLLQASASFVRRDSRPLPPCKPQISSFQPGHWAQKPIRYHLLHAFSFLQKEDLASNLHFGVLQIFLRQNLQSDS